MGKVQDQEALQRLLARVEKQAGGLKQDAANAIGITPSRYSKIYLGSGEYSLNVEHCLRLAELAGESPGAILRIFGKGDVAELIERLYGVAPERSEASLAPPLDPAHAAAEALEAIQGTEPARAWLIAKALRAAVGLPQTGPTLESIVERIPGRRSTAAGGRRRLARASAGRAR